MHVEVRQPYSSQTCNLPYKDPKADSDLSTYRESLMPLLQPLARLDPRVLLGREFVDEATEDRGVAL